MSRLPEPLARKKGDINVVIETPCNSRNKYKYDEESGLFKLSKVLPYGLTFPFSFGFIPGTKGGDGDPLDVLVLMDELTYPGCVIESRLIGVILANQKEKGKKKERNDRLIAVPVEMRDHDHIKELSDLDKKRVDDIVRFFEYYNAVENNEFQFKRSASAAKALRIVKDNLA